MPKNLSWIPLAIICSLIILVAGCSSAPASQPDVPSPEPVESTPSQPVETSPESMEPVAPEPSETSEPSVSSPEPVTAEPSEIEATPLAELNLADEPLNEKRLEVEAVYSGTDQPSLCYLGSYAMLAKYADSSLDFTDVVANSGYGTSAYYIAPANILVEGYFLWSIGLASGNLGFDYYVVALEGGTHTDDFLAAELPGNAEQALWMESEDAAFNLLKRLISSDIPVEVYLDCTIARDVLVANTSYWEGIFNFQDTYMNSAHVPHYFVATGYDDGYVYVNDPTEPQANMAKDIPIDTGTFLEAWQNGHHPTFAEEEHIGPYWMLFLGQRGTAKSAEELIAWNKDIAVKAPQEIRKAAANPIISPLIHCGNMCRSRQEFGNFLHRNGYAEAGDIFLEVSELFGGLDQSADLGADLLRIADLQEQSLEKW